MKICGYEHDTEFRRQVELSLTGNDSSCLKRLLFYRKNHMLSG